ncbi:MAG TPA: insulinase family protein, partial [Brumimicrobium sp.]|nr:insulinase family protein [Brumimicrobium sp.]
QEATMEEVKDFFHTHYHPGNAILVIAGNLDLEEVKRLVKKWYGDIPAKKKKVRSLPQEPKQTEFRTKTIERDVPSDVYTYGFKMAGKGQQGYYEADLISDILGRGNSSRLYKRLKKELELVTEINAYILGSIDPGMLMLSIHPSDEASLEQIDTEVWRILDEIKSTLIEESELEKIINKVKTTKAFSEQGVLNKSMALAANELMGDANLINTETEEYEKVTVEGIREQAKEILQKTNCSRLIIKAKKND